MAVYTFEVEPIVVTQLTGRLGTACAEYRGHAYRVTIGGPDRTTRDGKPCTLVSLPAPVYAHAKRVSAMLVRGWGVSTTRAAPEESSP